MIAQEHGPLAVVRNRWRLIENIDDRKAILHLQRHEHPRHEREVKIHVRFVAIAEVGDGVFRPLVRLGQKHAAGIFAIEVRAKFLQVSVRLGEILAIRSFALI